MSEQYVEFILDCLSSLENVSARKMFGGYGVYLDNIIIGIIADELFYLKVDDTNQKLFTDKNSAQFTYVKDDGKAIKMSYWLAPEDVLEDSEELCKWAKLSYKISEKNKLNKKPRVKKLNPKGNKKIKRIYNLGKVSQSWLNEIGIFSERDLYKIGSIKAFSEVRKNHKKVSLNLLWAMEAAIRGISWKKLDAESKSKLLKKLEKINKI